MNIVFEPYIRLLSINTLFKKENKEKVKEVKEVQHYEYDRRGALHYQKSCAIIREIA